VTVGAAALVLIQSGAAKGATADLLITGGERVWYFSFACYVCFVGRLEAVGRDAALDQLPPAAGFDAPLVAHSTLIGRLAVFLLSARVGVPNLQAKIVLSNQTNHTIQGVYSPPAAKSIHEI